jgi:hypothetical protein
MINLTTLAIWKGHAGSGLATAKHLPDILGSTAREPLAKAGVV